MYKAHFQKSFAGRIQSKKKSEKQKIKVFEQGVKKILSGKIQGTRFLKGPLRGKRCLRLPMDLRIVFAICEECIRLRHQGFNDCENCQEISSNPKTAVFFYAWDRKNDYRL